MLKLLLGMVAVAYPFVVYFGLKSTTASTMAAIVAVVVLLRFWGARSQPKKTSPFNLVAIAVLPLMAWGYFFNSELALKLYPVVVNLCFLAAFSYSLFRPPAIVTLIASLREKLDEEGIAYTRNLTKVWCAFFIVNGAVALVTVYHPNEQLWLIYNGFVSYVLMAILFVVEWFVRRRVKRHGPG